ncbi:MAG: alpha/beta hydrolase [Myxococcota bacterium]
MPDPRAPLHPQVKVLFDMMGANRAQRVLEPGPMREGLGALGPLLVAGAPSVAVEREIQIPGPAGALRARVFHPSDPGGSPRPVIVYFHGGGYVVMSADTHEKLTKQLCVGAGAVVVSVDYRLAPENRYPAPLDDCLAAFRWVREHARELGGDPARIAAAGDSAGGNAAAAVSLRLIAEGVAPPTALLLLCPWTDMALDTDSMRRFGPDDGVLDTDIMTWFRDCYVKPSSWSDPFASPLRGDLAKFPPTLVVVGEIDPLLDDGVLLAKKLEQAGRKVVLQSHAGMPHDFMLFPGIDEGARAIDGICRFAKSALGG